MMMRRKLLCSLLSSLALVHAWALPGGEEFLEDFSRVPAGSIPDTWRAVSGSWLTADGALVGSGRETDARLVLSGERWIDCSFAVDVTFHSETEPSRWVALTFSETGSSAAGDGSATGDPAVQGAPRYHTFAVRLEASAARGLEHAVRTADGSWDVKLARAHSTDLSPGKTARLEVQVVAGRMRGFIDGELVLDDPLAPGVTEGELGLYLSGASALFDNVHVRPLRAAEAERLRPRRDPRRYPTIIAHRGASNVAPENTMSAFVLAIENGAEGCEFDVYKTADDQLVLFHDKTLDRTTDFQSVYDKDSGKESKIEALTLEELRRLDAGSWKAPRFRGERIPTLLEALELMRGQITPVIEIKPDGIGRQVAQAIREADMVREVFVQSFSPQAIRDVRAELPQVPTGLLIGTTGPADPTERALDHLTRAREAGASAVVCHYRSIAPEYVAALHRRALTVWAYTIDDHAMMALLRDLGVDGIITDVPAEALQARSHFVPSAGATGGLEAPASPAAGSPVRRVDIVAGEIPVLEFARYYADALDLPLFAEGGDKSWEGEKILLPSTVKGADPELVKALLAESGYQITERRSDSGRRVVYMSRDRETAASRSPRATPIVEVAPSARAGRTSSRPRVAVAEAPESGSVEFRGLTITTVPEMLVAQTELPARAGVLVREKDEEAGGLATLLRKFDIVTYVGSDHVRSPADFKKRIETIRRGERTYIRALRKGKTVILPVRG